MERLLSSSFSPLMNSALSLRAAVSAVNEDDVGMGEIADEVVVHFGIQIGLGGIYLIDLRIAGIPSCLSM